MMGSFASLGLMLDPSVEGALQEQQALAFRNWLETNTGWLAIYDNVDEPASLAPFVPNNTKGDCLFISNDPKIRNLGTEVSIDTLETENAAKLLFRRSKANTKAEISFTDGSEETAFWRIVKDLDGLPVALNTTGAFIEEQGISYSEYLENLEASPDLYLDHRDDFDPYKKTVLKAFALAIDANTNLDDKFIGEAVNELYRAASLIAPDDIHEEFLRAYLEKNSEEFATSGEQNIFWQKIRKQLQGFDLFKYNSLAKSFSTHRLIQKCIQSRLGEAKKFYCKKVLNLLKDFFPEYDYKNKAECERHYQHTVTTLENAGKAGFEAGVSALLYTRVARYQELLGSYGQAEKFYQRDLEIARKVYGDHHQETASSLNNLAGAYDNQGKYDEAIELYLQAITIDEKGIGKEHPGYATNLNNLAEVYRKQGKYDKAIELYKQAIGIGEKTIGKEHPGYAIHLNNLALAYDAQGKYDEAIQLFKQVLEIDEKTIGKEHPNYASHLNNLAGAYKAQGKYDEAIELYKKAIEIIVKVNGKEHSFYATSLNNLAVVYDDRGKYDEAIGLYKEARVITGKALGKAHPDYARRLNNLAITYFNTRKYSEALPLFEEALRIWKAKLPLEHPNIANAKRGVEMCKEMLGQG
jgi:tetratricopeptide (TPR) repeat protein